MATINDAENLGIVFSWVWIASWFLAIWIEPFRDKLLLTGIFALLLTFGLAWFVNELKMEEKKVK